MTAMITPSTTPMTIAPTVPMSVPLKSPFSTGLKFMTLNTRGKFQTGFVTSELIIMATRTTMTTIASQRPGWRTGRAWMAPGRSEVSVVMRSGRRRRVDGEGADRSAGVAPLGERRLVGAVGVYRGERVGDGLGEVGLGLGQDEAVRGRVVDVAKGRELTVGLLHGIQADGGVGEHGGGLAGHDVGGHLGLRLLDDLLDRLLAGIGALLGAGGQVVDLDGALLDADGQAAGVVGVDLARVAGLGGPLGAGREVADHVGLGLAGLVDGERGDA